MTFTLRGRLQTRMFLVVGVGGIWTAIITPLLPSPPMAGRSGIGMAQMIMARDTVVIVPFNKLWLDYQITFETIAVMLGLGLIWECLYHCLQQVRWDKDWPPLFSLLEVIPEGLVLWVMINALGIEHGSIALNSPGIPMFAIHLISTWVIMWIFMVGPMHVISLRWRFEGGELITRRIRALGKAF